MIPKVVHYIWLGGKPKPPLVNICILSWCEKLPDYKIIEWNESNLDLDDIASKNRFFAECRKRRMWAYMADYLRLKILYEYGGIYMDTDMQVIKSLTPLLNNETFIGQENSNGVVSCGIIASQSKNPLLLGVLNFYDEKIWDDSISTIPNIFTKVLDDNTDVDYFRIYPPEYFYPYPYQTDFDINCIQENSYTIHWWAGSWIGKLRPYLFLSTKHIHNPLKKILISIKKAAGFYYKKWFKKQNG